MKMFTLVCIIAASAIATAQNDTGAAAANGNSNATETFKPEVKKVSKKVKKSVQKEAFTDEVTTETKKTVTDANNKTTTTTVETESPATGTSETVVMRTEVPTKNWKAAIATDFWVNRKESENMESATIDSENYLGAAYRVTDSTHVGVRQYFDYIDERNGTNTAANARDNSLETSYTAISVMPRFNGILGSKDFKPNFMVFLPTVDGARHFERIYGSTQKLDFNGYLRADGELAFEVSPLITLSYFFTARQFLFPTQDFINTAGGVSRVENISRLIHSANMYINVNDNIVPYAYLGLDNRMTTNDLTSNKDEVIAAIGTSFTIGALNITPEINNRSATKANRVAIDNPRLFKPEDMYYELYTTVSF